MLRTVQKDMEPPQDGGFVAGDRVRICKPAHSDSESVSSMRMVGHSGRVLEDEADHGVRVALHGAFVDSAARPDNYFMFNSESDSVSSANDETCVMVPSSALKRLPRFAAGSVLSVGCACRDGPGLLLWVMRAGLPEAVARCVMQFLTIPRVSDAYVRSVSSSRGDFPLSEISTGRNDTWWISSTFAANEWIEFQVSRDGGARRVSCVSLRIPPMPFGPLSVRAFDVLGLERGSSDSWHSAGSFETLDLGDLQEVALDPPLETAVIRVIVKSTAAPGQHHCGLFQAVLR